MNCSCSQDQEGLLPSAPSVLTGATGLDKFASNILGHCLTALDWELLEGVLKRNPVLAGKIDSLGTGMTAEKYETFVFTNIDVPIIQILQGLVRGLHQSLTAIPLPKTSGELYAGSIVDGLNPPSDAIVVNLDPDRVFLEDGEGVEVHAYTLHDTSDEEERAQVVLQLREAFAFVTSQLEQGKKILIHCMEGKNRTGVLVSMVLAFFSGKPFKEAFLEFMDLRGRHLGASPTQMYVEAACAILEDELACRMGKMTIQQTSKVAEATNEQPETEATDGQPEPDESKLYNQLLDLLLDKST